MIISCDDQLCGRINFKFIFNFIFTSDFLKNIVTGKQLFILSLCLTFFWETCLIAYFFGLYSIDRYEDFKMPSSVLMCCVGWLVQSEIYGVVALVRVSASMWINPHLFCLLCHSGGERGQVYTTFFAILRSTFWPFVTHCSNTDDFR